MTESIVTWLAETILSLGYVGIALLMTLESSFIPFPSEVVLPPAGFLAAQGKMSFAGALSAGLAGSLAGALINYWLAISLGRPFLDRYGKYVLVKQKSLDRAERFFERHGEISTFVGRLIPVIRQLISVPAGVARMRLNRFVAYTALGAGIWCAILTYIGWVVGKNTEVLTNLDEVLRSEQFGLYSRRGFMILVPFLLLVVGGYILLQRRRRRGVPRQATKREDPVGE